MTIEIKKKFNESIEKLKNGEPLSIRLLPEDIAFLITKFKQALLSQDWICLKKIIFIFQYAEAKHFEINKILNLAATTKNLPDELTIFLLGIYSKHVFIPLKRNGMFLDGETVTSLVAIGVRKSPEVYEWFLRAIESLEVNNLRKFKQIVLKKNPNIFQKINKKGRINAEISNMILNKIH